MAMNKRFLMVSAALVIGGIALAAAPWKTELKQSKLAFVGTQAGAEFEGVFDKFAADIQFDANDLATSRFDVTIDVRSVNSRDKERDAVIKSPDLFSADKWPTARYVTSTFADLGGGKYLATGKLTIRDVTRDVPVEFTHVVDASGAWLKGSAKIKRLEFGVGQGEWKDTQGVANDVRVTFALRLLR